MHVGKVHNLKLAIGYEICRAVFVILRHKLVVIFHRTKAVDVVLHLLGILTVKHGNSTKNQHKSQKSGNQCFK